MRSSPTRVSGVLLLISVLTVLSLSCRSEAPVEPTVDPVQTDLRTAIAGTYDLDNLKLEFARLAVRVAQTGCADKGERLVGEPTRILVSLTDSAVASKFISSEGKFQHGPGGIGSVPVLVLAVGGRNNGGPDIEFVFVEPLADSDFTTCQINDAPLAVTYAERFRGRFEFEVIDVQ